MGSAATLQRQSCGKLPKNPPKRNAVAVFRPTYKDPKTGERRHSKVWWYEFTIAGKRVRESTKTSRKTIAIEAERKRRLEYERSLNGVKQERSSRIQSIAEIGSAFVADCEIRHPRSANYTNACSAHVTRLLGRRMAADITPEVVKTYQTTRLKEGASPKTINEEVGFLLRILKEQGDLLRAKLRRDKALKLKVRGNVAKAWTAAEKTALLAEAKKRRSPCIYPALVLALNCGLRSKELRELQWARVDLAKAVLTVGDSKTEAGEGRTVPLNSEALAAITEHAEWFVKKFQELRPEWYLFPHGRPHPNDPSRPVTTLKTVWQNVRSSAGVTGRFHDNRHTFITDLAESGVAADETIRDIAGHVSPQMLKHYSHIRMAAKRRAVEALVPKESPKVASTLEDQKPCKPPHNAAT